MKCEDHNRESTPVSADSGDQVVKKTYRPPALINWGCIAELTRGNTTGTSDGGLTGSGGTT
jgi:hypothetical protein